jgi:hypothetical protein
LCDAPCVVVYNNIYLLRMRCCLISPPPQRCAALYYYNVCYTVRNHCTTHCTARVSKRRRSTFRAMCLLSFSLIPPLPSMPIPSGPPFTGRAALASPHHIHPGYQCAHRASGVLYYSLLY